MFPLRETDRGVIDICSQPRVVFAHLEGDGDVLRNPAQLARRARAHQAAAHREMDHLGLEEIPRYLDACEDVYRPLAEISSRRGCASATRSR